MSEKSDKVDKLIKWRTNGDFITDDDSSITPTILWDGKISEINNRDKEFSMDGVLKRELDNLEQRKENIEKSLETANKKEKKYLEGRLEVVDEIVEKNKIHNRFEILDI